MVSVSPLQRVSLTAGLTAVRPVIAPTPVGPATKAEEILPLEPPMDVARGASVQRPTQPATAPPTPELQKVVAAATQTAVARQTGLAPLMADLAEAATQPSLPPALRQAAAQVLAQRTPLTAGIQAADVQDALARSGLLMEARLADSGPPPAPQTDLKAALLALRQTLQAVLAGAAPEPEASAPRAPSPKAKAPPPPFRGGPTQGQPPVEADLPAATGAAARRLLAETNGALARQQLLQVASLPQPHDAAGPATRWMFEVPFATPQGAAVGQFEIARDPPPAGAADAEPTWRARFSLDLAPLGPLHAHVSLAGANVGVALWAERPGALAILREHQPRLAKALLAAQLSPDIAVYPGQPVAAQAQPGHFVDQAL